MRHVRRSPLPRRAASWLARQQSSLLTAAAIDVEKRWRERRKTMNSNGVVATLATMTGIRQRCMFCGDSHGGDIEHFRPKSVAIHRAHVFEWSNLLWLCTPCNRRKGNRFPVDPAGEPLLIDPTLDNPWDHLIYIPETGELQARYDPDCNRFDPKGTATIDDTLTRLNIEAVTENRMRVVRHARRYIEIFLSSQQTQNDADTLVSSCLDLDHPELLVWHLQEDGCNSPPFAGLINDHPTLTERMLAALETAAPGVCGSP